MKESSKTVNSEIELSSDEIDSIASETGIQRDYIKKSINMQKMDN